MIVVKNKRKLLLIAIDFIIMAAVCIFTHCLNAVSDRSFTINILQTTVNFSIFVAAIFASRILIGVYSAVWRYANSLSYLKLVISDFVGGVVACVIAQISTFSVGTWKEGALVCMIDIATLVSRFAYQHKYRRGNAEVSNRSSGKIPVVIIGAGQIGSILSEELLFDKNSKYNPLFFVDRDRDKVGSTINGLRVYDENEAIIEKIKTSGAAEIFIAIPGLSDERLKSFYDFYSRAGVKVKIYDFPIKSEASDENSTKRVVREVRIEDLLFRDSINVVDTAAAQFYKDKVVLVTGGGGSIGSELCRQIAKCSPKLLVILDIYENNAYDIQQELTRKYGSLLSLAVEIASVRDRTRLDAVFAYYKPDVVFHAAAHKHVPLMEHSNAEAIKNNIFGTYNTADMAEKYGAEKFILISTDKAVNPTNVMGASKRMCEMVIQARHDSRTVFTAVRFGNVLGSNGSVIPLFQRQIAAGGPVTITDKRIIRYFMTIPEASGLVMQAGAMANHGELFVLDMGKPVKIIDLAMNMIKLSGLNPYIDIDIVETGLRPGEKLYEELLIKTEALDKTENNLIFIERETPATREAVEEKLALLRAAVESESDKIASPRITEAMKAVVPTYHSPDEVNIKASEAEEMQLAGVK